ncbi:hypothetical protein E6C70_13490 [Glaciibacter flavus]|uniref:J domain-containing protein n=1 Tax=Orlajensenia flava TaxID=2565934 RepID=A0A4V3WTB9_9MICO|nr:hypothetical protein [Glaciibacter flavus]THG31307.1 hypothetical protein E6C70_13490 [Glaciibacter flavus]
MDIEHARAALGIAASGALFDEQIDAAYQRELELWHPLKYPEDERAPAVEWARHLGEARAELHAELARQRQRAAMIGWAPPGGPPLSGPPAPAALRSGPPPAAAPAPTAAAPTYEPVPRRRMAPGAVVATVAGAVLATALLAAPVVAAGVSLGRHLADASHSIDAATKAMSKADGASGTPPDSGAADAVSHYTSGETGFTFPANLDYYNDGRNTERCSSDLVDGCWSAAVFPEQDCTLLEVTYAFSNDETSVTPDDTRTTDQAEAAAFEPVILVWGSNDYDYSWIGDVQCVDPSDGDLSTTAEGSTAPA